MTSHRDFIIADCIFELLDREPLLVRLIPGVCGGRIRRTASGIWSRLRKTDFMLPEDCRKDRPVTEHEVQSIIDLLVKWGDLRLTRPTDYGMIECDALELPTGTVPFYESNDHFERLPWRGFTMLRSDVPENTSMIMFHWGGMFLGPNALNRSSRRAEWAMRIMVCKASGPSERREGRHGGILPHTFGGEDLAIELRNLLFHRKCGIGDDEGCYYVSFNQAEEIVRLIEEGQTDAVFSDGS